MPVLVLVLERGLGPGPVLEHERALETVPALELELAPEPEPELELEQHEHVEDGYDAPSSWPLHKVRMLPGLYFREGS